ncbi:MAG TPA: hypothetical protein DDZ80_14295 [Cyanobacteria bacterium UBA8803]|nr:hypothetical protein [Cyanobacteria bacterium UBA9273]HBL59608.1 hypothetical protein [Cyanobacteria bacterium UBA8803]
MTLTDTISPKASTWNRQIYQRLKLALSLGLRRQIFVAVCDDLSLRNRLAGKLHSELGTTSAKRLMDGQGYAKLVSLNINPSDPNPFGQMTQWLGNNRRCQSTTPGIGFQILGIERLTRQPPSVQRLFLRRLQAIERYLPRLEATLLLWLPRPWFHTIAQSVPEFWQWHTGVFEFEGEPTPLPPVGAAKPEASPNASALEETTGSFKEDLRTLLAQDLVETPELVSLDELARNNLYPSNEEEYSIALNEELETKDWGLSKRDKGKSSPSSNGEDKGDKGNKGDFSFPPTSYDQTPSPIPNAQSASPADAYLQLGNHYRQVIEQGDTSEENLAIAIQAYEQALQWLDNTSPQVSDILNDLGNLYWMLCRCCERTEHRLSYLEQAIQSYQLALTKLVAEDAPQTYAMVQNNLGAAYGDLARYKEPIESLELSIRAYEEALRYRSADSEPIKYASTQNNLGTAYWNLAQHQSPLENLRAAIGAYAEALCYYNTQTEPMNWAMIQNNLGTAYWNLAQYEQSEIWLELAVVAYKDALNYRTAEAAPAACAATHNNLGTAYWHLADRFQEVPQQRAEYLGYCIAAYEKAIALAEGLGQQEPPVPLTFDVVATRNNLGLAHYQLATEPEFSLDEAAKSSHLEAALEQHGQACSASAAQSDAYETALTYIIKTIRLFYQERGIAGQNLALSKVPGQLLPAILPRL